MNTKRATRIWHIGGSIAGVAFVGLMALGMTIPDKTVPSAAETAPAVQVAVGYSKGALRQAEIDGRVAREAGRDRASNPWVVGTAIYDNWNNGWATGQQLPDRTPKNVALEKDTFYLEYKSGIVDNIPALLRKTDLAVDMAHADGLTCNSVTIFKQWLMSKGFTLKCDRFDYTYYIEDKGRGYQIRIAD